MNERSQTLLIRTYGSEKRATLRFVVFGSISPFEDTLYAYREFYGVKVADLRSLFWKNSNNAFGLCYVRTVSDRTTSMSKMCRIRKRIPKAMLQSWMSSTIVLN